MRITRLSNFAILLLIVVLIFNSLVLSREGWGGCGGGVEEAGLIHWAPGKNVLSPERFFRIFR